MTEFEHAEITDPKEYFRAHPEFQECREYGHRFRPTHDGFLIEGPVKNPHLWYVKLRCLQGCGLTAEDLFNPRTRERIGSRRIFYSDAPDYLAHGTHITRVDARIYRGATQGARKGEPRHSHERRQAA